MSGHICAGAICNGGPYTEAVRKADGERWCFICRKRLAFEYVVKMPVEMSYWGPIRYVECSVCKTDDGDMFPGYQREWED